MNRDSSPHITNASDLPTRFSDDTSLPEGNADGLPLELGVEDFMPEDLQDSVRTAFCILYIVIIVLGLGGNCITALVIAVNREMHTVTNAFLLSLAVSDSLIAAVNMPLQLRVYQQNEWTMGQAACKLAAYIQGVVIVASILTLTSLAINR